MVAFVPGGNRVYSLGLRIFAVFLADHGSAKEALALLQRALAHFDLPAVEARGGSGILALDEELVREGGMLQEKLRARAGARDLMLRWIASSIAGHLASDTPRDRIGPSLATALHNAEGSGLPTH